MRISDWSSDVCSSDLVEVDLELRIRHAAGVRDHHLLDLGPRCVRLFTDDLRVHRHLAPAVNAIAVVEDVALDQLAEALPRTQIGARQEPPLTGARLLARSVPGTANHHTDEVLRV